MVVMICALASLFCASPALCSFLCAANGPISLYKCNFAHFC